MESASCSLKDRMLSVILSNIFVILSRLRYIIDISDRLLKCCQFCNSDPIHVVMRPCS